MLYLVKLDNTYKIGYSEDVQKRVKSFNTTHVDIELIAFREGGTIEERILHSKCSDYHIKGELFKIDDNVITIFQTYTFDNLSIEIDKLNKIITEKDKEIESLKTKLKAFYKKEEPEVEVPLHSIKKKVMVKGRNVNYDVKYYESYIKIGSLLFYDSINNVLNNEYGKEAKKYTTKSGIDMYYIDMGVALITSEINDIINNKNE